MFVINSLFLVGGKLPLWVGGECVMCVGGKPRNHISLLSIRKFLSADKTRRNNTSDKIRLH